MAHLPVDIQSNLNTLVYDDLENLIANLGEAFGESLIDLSSQPQRLSILSMILNESYIYFQIIEWWSELVFELGVERNISLRTFITLKTLDNVI